MDVVTLKALVVELSPRGETADHTLFRVMEAAAAARAPLHLGPAGYFLTQGDADKVRASI